MIKQITGSLPSRPRRYTLSRLLELAPSATEANIDLSKFTYDAARGESLQLHIFTQVLTLASWCCTSLGACVMATRRVVSDQPRNWSHESTESQEDQVAYTGRGVMQPERQPTVPPGKGDINTHKDKGFARFLEKHSSPTHQRVTTGGRIVPMEQRQRPPVFSSHLPPTVQVIVARTLPKNHRAHTSLHSPRKRSTTESAPILTRKPLRQPQPVYLCVQKSQKTMA